MKQTCCYTFYENATCSREAHWAFYPWNHTYNESYACDRHLSDLLFLDQAQVIWYIGEIQNGEEDPKD